MTRIFLQVWKQHTFTLIANITKHLIVKKDNYSNNIRLRFICRWTTILCDTNITIISKTADLQLPRTHYKRHSNCSHNLLPLWDSRTHRMLSFFQEDNPQRTATSLISSTFSLYSQSTEQKDVNRDTEFNPSWLFLCGTLTAFGLNEIEISAPARVEGLK